MILLVTGGSASGKSEYAENRALQMAKEGKTYEEILQFFFEGTELADGGDVATMVHPGEASEK